MDSAYLRLMSDFDLAAAKDAAVAELRSAAPVGLRQGRRELRLEVQQLSREQARRRAADAITNMLEG